MVSVVEHGQVASAAHVRAALDSRGLTGAPGVTIVIGDAQSCERGLLESPARPTDRVVVLLEGSAGQSALWQLLDAGADDVVPWSADGAASAAVANRIERWVAVERMVDSPVVASRMLGGSPALRAALRQLVELAVYGQGPILLLGQTGTGKELAAQIVHLLRARGLGEQGGDLVVVDCTTIVPTLSGSELFGHERGAFTGADRARTGAVAQADGGTLFLDEVGDLPATLQGELLRVVQEGVYKRVGGSSWNRTSFRLVSATHRDLARDQRRGRFRSDLYHRITAGVVQLPSLRERRDDIEELFSAFLGQALGTETPPSVSPAVADMLRERPFPGNVRELRQLAIRVATRHVGDGPVTVGDIPPADRPRRASRAVGGTPAGPVTIAQFIEARLHDGMGLRELKALVGNLAVEVALAEAHGNLRAAAELLGVTVRALQLRRQGSTSPDA